MRFGAQRAWLGLQFCKVSVWFRIDPSNFPGHRGEKGTKINPEISKLKRGQGKKAVGNSGRANDLTGNDVAIG